MSWYEGVNEAVDDFVQRLVISLYIIAVVIYLAEFAYIHSYISAYRLSAPVLHILSTNSGSNIEMPVDFRGVVEIVRVLMAVFSSLTECASIIYVMVKAAKDPGWGIGYSITLPLLNTLATLVLALLVYSQLYSFASDILPSLLEIVDPSADVLAALSGLMVGIIIGGLGGYYLRNIAAVRI